MMCHLQIFQNYCYHFI